MNVRFEPSEYARIRMRVYRDQRVVAMERRGAWVRIRVIDTGERGWIHGSFLTSPEGEPPAAPTVTQTEVDVPKPKPAAATTGASIAPQAGPEALGLPAQATTDVAAHRRAGNPPVITAQSEQEAAPASTPMGPEGDATEAPAAGDLLIVKGNGVNVRFEPSEDARIRMRVYRDQRVVAMERRGVWVRVRVSGTGERGWIYGSLLASSGGEPQAPPVVAESEVRVPKPKPAAATMRAAVAPQAGPEVSGSPTQASADVGADRRAGNPPIILAQSEQEAAPTPKPVEAAPPKPVGEAPPEETKPSVALQALDTGVLTPKGTLVLEPSFEFAHSSTNRFTFRGIELIEAVQIGVIEAENADRDFYQAALTARYGLSPWLEAELRVPGIYRNDKVQTSSGTPPTTQSSNLDNLNIGDVEAAVHYQLNRTVANKPVFVANLRGRFPTGENPFEVNRDPFGVEKEVPTGSGAFGIEPSLTALYTTDPLVLFGNIGYLYNISRDYNKVIATEPTTQEVGRVDLGDAVRIGFGFSFAVNETTLTSLSVGYDFIDGTKTEINGVTSKSEDLQVGSMTAGVYHRINDTVAVNLSAGWGVTSDASDIDLLLRVPLSFNLGWP